MCWERMRSVSMEEVKKRDNKCCENVRRRIRIKHQGKPWKNLRVRLSGTMNKNNLRSVNEWLKHGETVVLLDIAAES